MAIYFQHYYYPAEAAIKLGISEEIRQRVLWYDFEPKRLPLYWQITKKCRVHWVPDPEFDHEDPTARFEHEWNQDQRDRINAQMAAVRAGPKPCASETSERDLQAGQYFEIHPSDGHEVAARPNEVHLIRALRSPAYSIGDMPARSLIIIDKADAIPLKYSECLIGEADLCKEIDGAPKRTRQINAILKAVLLLGFDPMAVPARGKRRVFNECVRDKTLFNADSFANAFDKAWTVAKKQGLVKSAVSGGCK